MIVYIDYQYVIEIHDNLIYEYGGRKGILNEGLLKSALEMQKARFNYSNVFLNSNFKKGFCISETGYQEIILGIAQGLVTKKEIAKFFRKSQLEK